MMLLLRRPWLCWACDDVDDTSGMAPPRAAAVASPRARLSTPRSRLSAWTDAARRRAEQGDGRGEEEYEEEASSSHRPCLKVHTDCRNPIRPAAGGTVRWKGAATREVLAAAEDEGSAPHDPSRALCAGGARDGEEQAGGRTAHLGEELQSPSAAARASRFEEVVRIAVSPGRAGYFGWADRKGGSRSNARDGVDRRGRAHEYTHSRVHTHVTHKQQPTSRSRSRSRASRTQSPARSLSPSKSVCSAEGSRRRSRSRQRGDEETGPGAADAPGYVMLTSGYGTITQRDKEFERSRFFSFKDPARRSVSVSPRGLQWKGSWSQAAGEPCPLGKQIEAAAARTRKAEEDFEQQLAMSRERSLMRARGQLLHPVATLPSHGHRDWTNRVDARPPRSSAVVRDGLGSRLETTHKPVLESLLLG